MKVGRLERVERTDNTGDADDLVGFGAAQAAALDDGWARGLKEAIGRADLDTRRSSGDSGGGGSRGQGRADRGLGGDGVESRGATGVTALDVHVGQVVVRAHLVVSEGILPALALLARRGQKLVELLLRHGGEVLLDGDRLTLRGARAGEVFFPSLEEEIVGGGGIEWGLMFGGVELFNVEEVGAKDGGEVALEAPVADALGVS